MLYCPKCRRTYEDGKQRFCDLDGKRLMPAPSAQNPETKKDDVFSNLLEKTRAADDADKKLNQSPRFIPLNKTEEPDKQLTSFPSAGRIFQSEQFLKPKAENADEAEDSILELEPFGEEPDNSLPEFEPILKTAEETRKPAPRLIKPSEIASGTADVGNRKTNPLGREALSWENLDALLGQTVKGRYLITEELEEDDEESVIYLAEDKIVTGKKVVVRVFMNDHLGADEAEEKIFAEEKVVLSHLNHPNIAGIFDSGELPEGNEFIVSEFVEGKSLAEMLRESGQFNFLRAARIIRQTSYALSEAHQNGILHRNLKPENIVLTISEAGIEQVKLMNFGVSHGEITQANLAYKAPEEIEKGNSTYASDIYALGVIAYQMLTGQMPYPAATENVLLRAQKAGLTLLPTTLRLDIQPLTDKILEKALAFNPSERYPKARDFGDAFFNALTTVAPLTNDVEEETPKKEEPEDKREFIVVPAINQKQILVEDAPIEADIHITPEEEKAPLVTEVKTTDELAWEKRSPELLQTGTSWRGWLAIPAVVLLLLAFWGISRLIVNRTEQPQNRTSETPAIPAEKAEDNLLPAVDTDLAPPPRLQSTAPGTVRFQNSRDGLKSGLAKNFLGFEIFYPQNWTKNPTETNFLDISKSASNGFPIEQMIITRYESRGNMTLDRPNFPKFVEASNQYLKCQMGESYKVLSEGETVIQNGRWKAYEVKFQGETFDDKGEKVTVWGRRLWIPVQRAGVRNGFVITLLATSLSDLVISVDDVGVKGELANVLETFEPEQIR